MINFEEKIKKMNIGEKVIQVASEIGFIVADINTAKLEVHKGIAKFGLVILQEEQEIKYEGDTSIVKSSYQISNIHNPNERLRAVSSAQADDVTQAQALAYEAMLLNTFSISVSNEVRIKNTDNNRNNTIETVNTVNEAVSKASVLRGARTSTIKTKAVEKRTREKDAYGHLDINMSSEFASIIENAIGAKLRQHANGNKVSDKVKKVIYAKLNCLGINKNDFMAVVCKIIGIYYDYELTHNQAQDVIDYLIELEEEVLGDD